MERGRRSLITNSFFRSSPPLQLLARSYPDFFIPSRWCGFIDHDSSSQLATSLPVPRFSWSSYKPFRDLIVLQTNRSIRACWIINENNCSFGHLCPRNDISGTRFWFFLTSNLSNIEPVWWLEFLFFRGIENDLISSNSQCLWNWRVIGNLLSIRSGIKLNF